MSNFDNVKKFMETFGQEVKEKAEFPEKNIISLRYDLIREELDELKEAMDKRDYKRSCRCFNRYFVRNLWCWACLWYKFR